MASPSHEFEALEAALDVGDLDEAASRLAVLRRLAPDGWERSWAEVAWLEASGAERTRLQASLHAHLERWPSDADAMHWLGALLFDAGRMEQATACWQQVLALDAAADDRTRARAAEDEAFVEEAALEAINRLPDDFLRELDPVPVLLEERPSPELVAGGFDPRALGLFQGPDRAEVHGIDPPPQATRIVLYVANLVASFPEDEELAEQVAITVRHEVGHFFGLDEDDMVRLGLD